MSNPSVNHSGREHVAALCALLARTPEIGWTMLLISEIRKHPTTFDYLCAESVEGAMLDVGATTDLIERVCKKLEASKVLLPSTLRVRIKP